MRTSGHCRTDLQKRKYEKSNCSNQMTLDGFCDHTSGVPDEEIHQHYADLLRSADIALYGRITYQLMDFSEPCSIGHFYLQLIDLEKLKS